MDNSEVARVLYEVADLLELLDVKWKPRAYRQAARYIESMGEDINRVEDLDSLPGVGVHISGKIRELLDTGELEYLKKLKRKIPVKYDELNRVEGLGPKRIKELYDKLGVRDLKSLRKAIDSGELLKLEGFGEKLVYNILEGIRFAGSAKNRFLLGDVYDLVYSLGDELSVLKQAGRVEVCGSVRRMKETVHDADLLVCSDSPGEVMRFFTGMKQVKRVLARGDTKASVLLFNDFQVDLRVVPSESFGAALNYFTGSKSHNIALRSIAIRKGLKLSEYGLFRGNKQVGGRTESDLYEKLGLRYVEPEMRENLGEIDLSMKGKLPVLVSGVKGDLQMHSEWSDGSNSVKEMVDACRGMGYSYCGLTDHAGNLKVAGAMGDEQIPDYLSELSSFKFPVLKGVEADIKSDGSLSVPQKLLDGFDFVVGGVHSGFKQSRDKMTVRIIDSLDRINIFAHPTGRLLDKRSGYVFDYDKVFGKCAELGVVLEVNAQPPRLDLPPELIRRAYSFGCRFVINTDAHSVKQLGLMKFGVGTARRGWLESRDVINSYSIARLKKVFKK